MKPTRPARPPPTPRRQTGAGQPPPVAPATPNPRLQGPQKRPRTIHPVLSLTQHRAGDGAPTAQPAPPRGSGVRAAIGSAHVASHQGQRSHSASLGTARREVYSPGSVSEPRERPARRSGTRTPGQRPAPKAQHRPESLRQKDRGTMYRLWRAVPRAQGARGPTDGAAADLGRRRSVMSAANSQVQDRGAARGPCSPCAAPCPTTGRPAWVSEHLSTMHTSP